MTRGWITAFGAASLACVAAAHTPGGPPPALLRPGDPSLVEAIRAGEVQELRLFEIDSAGGERQMGESRVTIRALPGEPGRLAVVQTGRYRGSSEWSDSMVVRIPGLEPQTERITQPGRTTTYRYDRGTVDLTIERADSEPVTRRLHYPGPVFGFSQLYSILRSIPYCAGYARVVPLFSEGDNDLEYDTVRVIGRTPSPVGTGTGTAAWKIRFADPVIVNEVIVDETTRHVISEEITRRADGTTRRAEHVYLSPMTPR